MKVRITGGSPFYDERARRMVGPGEVVDLHPAEAEGLIDRGEAQHTRRCRVTRDGVVIGNRCCMAGEEVLAPEERIKRLAAQGVVEDLGPVAEAVGADSKKGRRS